MPLKTKYSEEKSKIELRGLFFSVDIVRGKIKTEQIAEGIKELRIYSNGKGVVRGCREGNKILSRPS